MTAVGIKAQQGLNSGTLMGHAPTTVEVDPKDEIRSSSEESFLQSAIRNTSIRVYHHTMAKRILFNRNKKATGVIVETDGKTYTLSAHKEIIVSAGAVSYTLSMRIINVLPVMYSSIHLSCSWSPVLDLVQP